MSQQDTMEIETTITDNKIVSHVDPFAGIEPFGKMNPIDPSGGFNDLRELRADFPNLVIMPISLHKNILGPAVANKATFFGFNWTFPEGAKIARFIATLDVYFSFQGNPQIANVFSEFDNSSQNNGDGCYLPAKIWSDVYYIGNNRQISFLGSAANIGVSFEIYMPDRYKIY